MIKNSIFIALFVCIYLTCTVYSQGAPCVFNTPLPINPDYYWTSLASFRACLPNIPADKDMIANTLDIAVATSNGYSYEYMVQNSTYSGSAYSISVNLKNRIQQIRNKNYDFDYQFHKELMGLFFSLYDAHTIYMPPNPYKNSYLVFPFDLTSSITNVGQVISVKADNRLYSAITGSNSGAAGKTIRTINGVKPKDFLDSIANTIFMSKEAASRFNEVIKMQEMSLGALIMPEFDSLNYVFSDGSSLNLPLVVLLSQQINGPKDFKNLMAAQPSKSRIEVRVNNNQKRAPTMAVDPRMVIPELSIPKIVYKKTGFESKLRGMAAGNLKLLYSASDKSIAYLYHTTRKISVFKIESFAPNYPYSQYPWDEFKSIVERGVAHAQSVGVKSLVLDLQGNGGGYVCLSIALARLLIAEYSDLSKLYQPFEFKKNPLVDSARPFFIQPNSMLNATNLQLLPNADFYERGVTKKLGGVIASYSQQFYLDCASEGNFFFKPATHYFNKFIILTDGLCGSSCSQFASKLIYNKKALAANVGGYDSTFETTAFNGGAVLHYDDLVKRGAPIPRLTKSNAVFTFNEFHMYLNAQQPIPREFQILRGDIKINSWDFDDLEGLVDTVAPQFDKMTPLNQ
ncbi:predicted protein [Naegleria gruberi]|uniref:Predicted protein n=1 Tax=Naegleria gruberi TaxID=5762 RepID=D2VNV2_NAEGR|nr:uncharacterized protein NAEGRDRAFT_80677 [Naegleria gruberi]EFC41481.1 predicted protein [Naegleria gruberi]|eukprot:XP_002674225.1 predicted protein [Naegleria gruberi strain NEG-M]